jgi:hypothetical protein
MAPCAEQSCAHRDLADAQSIRQLGPSLATRGSDQQLTLSAGHRLERRTDRLELLPVQDGHGGWVADGRRRADGLPASHDLRVARAADEQIPGDQV